MARTKALSALSPIVGWLHRDDAAQAEGDKAITAPTGHAVDGSAISSHVPAQDRHFAPLIALVGCDGSGKSTLSADLHALLAIRGRIEICYLGLGSGDLGRRIGKLPLVGPSIARALARKATKTRSGDETIPGLPTALIVFGFSLLRLRRFRHVLALRRRGVTVITDRYPQAEIAGFYDGPGLSAARAGSLLVSWLAARERAIYEWMASFRPSVVLRLNIDADTAYARKPDHALDLLREKVSVTPLLRFNGARIVELDAHQPYCDVRRQALQSVRPILSAAAADFNRAPALGGPIA